MILQLASANSLDAAAQSVLEKNQLTLVESKEVTVNGLPALAVVADQVQEQQTLRTLTYLISYGDNIYTIMGVSTENDFQAFQSVFVNTMNNFDILTDPAKLNRKPERINIETVKNSGTLSDVFRNLKVEEARMDELAILNGMELNDRVEKGTLVKTISR
jgi:predicted Zn-dependent protease